MDRRRDPDRQAVRGGFPRHRGSHPARRGTQKAPTKQMVSLRLDVDVLEKFRATGKGWQARMNATLAAHAPRRAKGSRTPRPSSAKSSVRRRRAS
jgi:uncharacterized protein (DUF4415 family)